MYKNIILPASLLAGTIIGAGIFALPFVFEKAGIAAGLFYLGLFSTAFIFIHLMYAEIILKTKEGQGLHRFPNYAQMYLGNFGFWSAIFITVIGMVFVLTVYLVLSASFANLIEPAGWDLSVVSKIAIFWLLGSIAIFLEIRRMALLEFLITGGIIAVILIIFIYGFGHFDKALAMPMINLSNILLPYGAVLFALNGRVAIPAVIAYFKKMKLNSWNLPLDGQSLTNAKKSIILASLTPAIVYLLFIFGVWGLSGEVSEDAVSGLMGSIPMEILKLIGIFGFISLWSSYIIIGLDVKNALKYDLKFPGILAGLIVVVSPLLLFFAGFQNFLVLVGIVGGVFIALEGIFVVMMWLKALKSNPQRIILRKLNPLIIYALIFIFIGGIIYELTH